MRELLATGPAPTPLFGMKMLRAARPPGETRPEATLLRCEDCEFGDVRVGAVVAWDDASRSEHGGRQDGEYGQLHGSGLGGGTMTTRLKPRVAIKRE